jgi:hypothetical protein
MQVIPLLPVADFQDLSEGILPWQILRHSGVKVAVVPIKKEGNLRNYWRSR